MDLDEYQRLAMRTNGTKMPMDAMNNSALGICGEGGEYAEHVKKILFHGHELDIELRAKMAKELGDVLWYVAQGCSALGLTLGEVGEENIEKLRRRYPTKFNTQDSLARRDVQPDPDFQVNG